MLTVALWFVARWVSPSPPRSLVMSTGPTDGAYYRFGLRYQEILRENGVELQLRTSSGGVENLARLNEGSVSVGFVQGGTVPLEPGSNPDVTSSSLRSLATIGYEPVWIFTHTLDLSQGAGVLAGKRVAVGVAGSGNYQLATTLLATYGVATTGSAVDTTIVREGGLAAVDLLLRHEIDAVIIVAAPTAPAVQRLLSDGSIHLASLAQAEGLARRHRFLQTVSLKRGSVDPQRNLPDRDIALLTTTTNLVVRDELHPALAYLLLEAARSIHAVPSLLNAAADFPSPKDTDFSLAGEADRYFKNGRPFLQSGLPFWMANFVQRLLFVLVPLAALLIPIANLLPGVLNWRRQTRLYRRYGELKFLERDIADRALSDEERRGALNRLDRIECDIVETKFPLEFSDRVYTLRQHVDYVRRQLSRPAGV